MALAYVHRSRAEKNESVIGKWSYLDPTEARLAIDEYVIQR